MEKVCNGPELDIPAVYEVIGEPAIVINGVPDVTPGSTACIMDTTTALESDDDPCFGDWLEGRKVQKVFGDQYYFGKVERYDSDMKWYRVVYEDGDFEDLEWHELEELLLPLDISVPITTFASEKVFPNSQIKMGRKRKTYLNGSGREGKTSELLQITHVGEARDETLMGTDFSGRALQGSLGMQNGLKMENQETYVLTHEYTTTSDTCNGQELYSVPVSEGELSVLINHVPAAPGYSTTIHETGENSRAVDSPYFGKCLEGRKVQKFFGDRYYSGNVEKYDEETKWYRVVYEDGDFEDLEWHELEEVLLPLDVSTPLTNTASHRYKSKKSAPKLQVKKARGRKNHAISLTRKGKTSQLLQITKVGKLRDEKLMEENFSGTTSHGTLQVQNGLQTENQGTCDGQPSPYAPVFDVVGEPAVVINGVPVATPGFTTTTQDNVDNLELAGGPSYGEWLEGRQVQKLLGDQHYSGKVERYNKGTKRYRIVYEDGGFEDLQWHELEGMLVPFDVSVPIPTLASNLCKSGNLVFEQQVKLTEARKDHTYSFQNMEKAVKPVEANSRDRAHQGNAQMQKGSTIESIEANSQMRRNEVSVLKSEEGSITSKDN
ncbi:uncharacterized protein A4U43_C02F2130 [Asparagus officinalis]|uniref:Tudor domain-containing protein n=1 Tax=Asparagus officinalis TaxID=4686 RepID=A0A5P1FF50_ASPOF|nr:uncharacterized protein LOC109829939 [Asparagus officinalis]ONK77005.1 uncharacterized protein A4U43_C02F2130 [Asparagus officinalis]